MSILIQQLRRFLCIVLLGCIGSGAALAATTDQLTSFYRAVEMDDATTVGRMIAARQVGANAIDPRNGEPALILALREGSNRVIDVLLADPAIDLEINAPNTNTALMMAAFKHNKPAVLAMLAKGAVVNRPGWTALHYAAASGDDEIAGILLAHKAAYRRAGAGQFHPADDRRARGAGVDRAAAARGGRRRHPEKQRVADRSPNRPARRQTAHRRGNRRPPGRKEVAGVWSCGPGPIFKSNRRTGTEKQLTLPHGIPSRLSIMAVSYR